VTTRCFVLIYSESFRNQSRSVAAPGVRGGAVKFALSKGIPAFNTIVRGEPLNSRPQNLATRN